MMSLVDYSQDPTHNQMKKMGELKDPSMREKYSRKELIELLDRYDALVKQIESLRLNLRETTIEVNSATKRKNEKLKKQLVNQKNNLFNLCKLRHTIICGIPCHNDHCN